MYNPRLLVLCLVGLSVTSALAQEDQKPNLTGTWQLSVAKSEIQASKLAAATWSIEHRGLSIHISRVEKSQDGKETKKELRCTIGAKECEAGDTKISLWYDGNVLVAMEAGDTILKYNMALAAGGKALTVAVTHIVPGGANEKLFFDAGGL